MIINNDLQIHELKIDDDDDDDVAIIVQIIWFFPIIAIACRLTSAISSISR